MTLHHGRLGGGLLLAFLLPVIIVVHGYEKMDADSKVMRALQEAQFIEGFALPGAALLIRQLGVGQREVSGAAPLLKVQLG